MKILKRTLEVMLDAIGSSPIESGGIIGFKNDSICAFEKDGSYHSRYEYRPDAELLNSIIGEWNREGISFCGIVHSHLYGFNSPSLSDKVYASNLVRFGENISEMFFPIVTVNEEGRAAIDFFRYDSEKDSFDKKSLGEINSEEYELI